VFLNVGDASAFGDSEMLKFGKRFGNERRSGKDRRVASEAEAERAKTTIEDRRANQDRRSGRNRRKDAAASALQEQSKF
jgi:hypothetical protein